MDWNRCPPHQALPWLRITLIPGLSPRALRALLDWAGTPQALLDTPPDEIRGLAGDEIADALARGPDGTLFDAALRWLDERDHHVVCLADPLYPAALLQLGAPPPLLYAQGRLELLAAPSFAIVGSRNATAQGLRDAEGFAKAISGAGLTIVSGLAMGIDAAAHRGGLAAAGSSIAILGNGPDIVYPAGNRPLAAALAAGGCLLSEFPLATPPLARNFPRRNRLISGMSKGVLVVEAGIPSGSLTTAQLAIEQGRDVFAIPGSIHSPLSKGCHRLIQQGAKLVETAGDVLAELGWHEQRREGECRAPAADALCGDPVLEALAFASATLDQLAARTGLDAASIAARMSMLELQGRVVAHAGGTFQAVAAR